MNEMDTYELTEFNLKDAIVLDEKCGLIKITRSDDGRLILVCDGSYDLIPQEGPSERPIASVDSALGFTLDIGIRREKRLTNGHGYYFGHKLIQSDQSKKEVSTEDYDSALLEKIVSTIDTKYHSRYQRTRRKSLQLNHLIVAYNDARLLYPNFYNSSYLSLARIIDALSKAEGCYDFALWACKLSAQRNRHIYRKISEMGALKLRIDLSETLFTNIQASAPRGNIRRKLRNLSRYQRFVFVCFYSLYQYRSKFVHQGFPFPRIVIESMGVEEDAGSAYLNPAVAQSHMRIYRPTGMQTGDDVDIHTPISFRSNESLEDFKDYFQLLPSWHWLKLLTRDGLVQAIDELGAAA